MKCWLPQICAAALLACGDANTTSSNGSTSVGTGGTPNTSSGTAGAGGDHSASGGGSSSDEFCAPALNAEASQWRSEYDVFFANTTSMRRYLDDVEDGSGGHWSQTYTLRSLMLMFELTGEVAYLDELVHQGQRVVAAAEGYSWPTGVCGNSFEHSTVVIDALMLYPLLRAAYWMTQSRLADDMAPEGSSYGKIANGWVAFAVQALQAHEGELVTIASADEAYYVFPSSYTCVAGDVQPFNYANAAGKAYAALWRLTGDAAERLRAERLLNFWHHRTYKHKPNGGSASIWWGYRGVVGEVFDPDAYPATADQRPEDIGHADHSADFAGVMTSLGLAVPAALDMDEVALTSKRLLNRAVNNQTNPSYFITNDDTNGEWTDMFDHLPMSCYRKSIVDDLAPLAPLHLTNNALEYRRAYLDNLAEFAFYSEYAGSDACGPSCGDGICSGPEDCVACPNDCGECPVRCR